MNLGTPELLIILVIVLLLFGVGRISKISGELGKSIRSFKDGLGGNKDDVNSEDKSEPTDSTKKS
jgi:sec-independent protein translocase protein TatA